MPAGREEFAMRDYVRRTGGVVLENLLLQTVQDDAQIARILAVCAGRALSFIRFVFLCSNVCLDAHKSCSTSHCHA